MSDIQNRTKMQEALLKAVDTLVTKRTNDLKLDKTITCIVKNNIGTRFGKPLYQVKYEGGEFTALAQNATDSYQPNTKVYVMVPQNDFSKQKIILGRANTISTSKEAVAVSAAINNYSLLGGNLFYSLDENIDINNISYGLRSYHSIEEEKTNKNSIVHRSKFIYNNDNEVYDNVIGFNDSAFKIYSKEALTFMIKADFRTNLNIEQRSVGEAKYAIGITMVFDNLNKGYGRTQGEVLKNLGAIIVGTPNPPKDPSIEEEGDQSIYDWTFSEDVNNLTLAEFDERIQYYLFAENDPETIIPLWQLDDIGLFDYYIQSIKTMFATFKLNASTQNQTNTYIDNTVEAYLGLLAELKLMTGKNRQETLDNIRRVYKDWKQQIVGDLDEIESSFIFSSDQMIGNPYAFTSWNTQYLIINGDNIPDWSNFKYVKNIIFYKEGFIEDAEKERNWPPSKQSVGGGADIEVRNLQLYLLKEIDENNSNYNLSVECAQGTNGILKSTDANEKVVFQAKVIRQKIEEITRSQNLTYKWFKQSSEVINATSSGYNLYAGVGWKNLYNTKRYNFITSGADNLAYENKYKCVAIYRPNEEEIIPLKYEFSVYNEAVATKIQLSSDLGTEFDFSEGSPTITCKIKESENGEYLEVGTFNEDVEDFSEYRYKWSITNGSDGTTTYLEEAAKTYTTSTTGDRLLDNLQLFKLNYPDNEVEKIELQDSIKATRIKIPVSLSGSGFTVTCILQKYINNKYRDIGSDSIEITNKKFITNPSGYRIVIENGDQVFQYDEYGKSPKENSLKEPLEIKPLRAKLITPNGLEIKDGNFSVEWIFPIENTMIKGTNLMHYPPTDQDQLIRGQECPFDIAGLYNPEAQNNQITCVITLSGHTYTQDTNFYFGKVGNNGTNGTDVISKISLKDDYYDYQSILSSQPLILYTDKVEVKNDNDEISTQIMGLMNIDYNGTPTLKSEIVIAGDSSKENNLNSPYLDISLYQKNEIIAPSKYAIGYPRWNLAGNSSGTSNRIGKYFKIDSGQIIWSPEYNNNDKHMLLQNIKTEVEIKGENNEDNQTYYSYFSLPIIAYEGVKLKENSNPRIDYKASLVNLIGIDKKYYLNEVVYNADGRNPIFNHNQGLRLINLPDNATVIWQACGGINAEKRPDSNSVVKYLESAPDFTISFEPTTKKTSTYTKLSSYSVSDEDEKMLKVAYEKAREEESKKYFIIENNKVIEQSAYKEYEKNFKADAEEQFRKFKEQKRKELQDEKIIEFLGENYQNNPDDTVYKEVVTQNELKKGLINEDYDLKTSAWFFKTDSMPHWWNEEEDWEEDKYKLEQDPNDIYTYYIKTKVKENEYENTVTINKLNPQDLFNQIYPEFVSRADQIAGEETSSQIINNAATIYVLPADNYSGIATNNRIEAKVYVPELNENNTVVTDKDNNPVLKLYATVYAPINMTLNTFGLASINAWDGNTITTDTNRGAILAPQIGAGVKDSNNRFTGIVMGKTETYTGDSANERNLGLMGYSYGEQSIFLDAETGNAFFGLPDGKAFKIDDKTGKPIGFQADDYNEGRVELRPGDISKIGGWRLGRRSLYYTMKPNSDPIDSDGNIKEYNYIYSGEIGQPYKGDLGTPLEKSYADHHEKDINPDDSGLLLSADPSYISIKGKKLGSNDIDSGLNSQLMQGDSLEIQLDPQTPTLFTIFRHNGQFRGEKYKGKRQYLAGINDKGELLANGVGKEDSDGTGTKSGNIILKAFKDTKDQESGSYVGSVFEAGSSGLSSTRTFFQIFVEKTKASSTTSQVFLTGGQSTTSGDMKEELAIKNEYQRPISIHGESIMLYAKTGTPKEWIHVETGKGTHIKKSDGTYEKDNKKGDYIQAGYDWTSTDANIQISTDSSQIQLGDYTNFSLKRGSAGTNELKTAGKMQITIGSGTISKSLTYNSGDIDATINGTITSTATGNIQSSSDADIIITSHDQKTIQGNNFNRSRIYMRTEGQGSINLLAGLNTSGGTTVRSRIDVRANGVNRWLTEEKSLILAARTGKNNFPAFATNDGTVTIWSNISDSNGSNAGGPHSNGIDLDGSDNHGIELTAKNGKYYTQLRLNAAKRTPTAANIPFSLNLCNTNDNSVGVGQLYVIEGEYTDLFTINGMNTAANEGLRILGNFTYDSEGTDSNDTNIGLRVENNILTNKGMRIKGIYNDDKYKNVGLQVDHNIQTNGTFWGNGQGITNTADGSFTTGTGASISGWGESGTASFAAITMSNGRPNFSTRTISVTMPSKPSLTDLGTLADLGGVTEARVIELLKDYAKSSDLDQLVDNVNITGTTLNVHYVGGASPSYSIPVNSGGSSGGGAH